MEPQHIFKISILCHALQNCISPVFYSSQRSQFSEGFCLWHGRLFGEWSHWFQWTISHQTEHHQNWNPPTRASVLLLPQGNAEMVGAFRYFTACWSSSLQRVSLSFRCGSECTTGIIKRVPWEVPCNQLASGTCGWVGTSHLRSLHV